MGALQDLPNDVLLIILLRLAAQDPVSLVCAMCAYRAFYEVGADSEELWKAAFFAPSAVAGPETLGLFSGAFCEEVKDTLNKEVENLGGCQLLMRARMNERLNQALHPDQIRPLRASPCRELWPSNLASSPLPVKGKIVILIRFYELPVAVGLYDPQEKERLKAKDSSLSINRSVSLKQIVSLPLDSLLPFGETKAVVGHEYSKLQSGSPDVNLFRPGVMTVEFYAMRNLGTIRDEASHMGRSKTTFGKLWHATLHRSMVISSTPPPGVNWTRAARHVPSSLDSFCLCGTVRERPGSENHEFYVLAMLVYENPHSPSWTFCWDAREDVEDFWKWALSV